MAHHKDHGLMPPSESNVSSSQISLELRKYFAPGASDFNETLNDDGALYAYAETIVWRLNAAHVMVSLIDRNEQFFLGGCSVKRVSDQSQESSVVYVDNWFSCNSVQTAGGLCENTIAIDDSDDYPCFIVPDLSKDSRFSALTVVDGTVASYRFYAGVPLTTSNGMRIGSFFLFDDKPRETLLKNERKFLYQQADNVMRHLRSKRNAVERGRASLMSRGLASFLEKTSHAADSESTHSFTPVGSQSGDVENPEYYSSDTKDSRLLKDEVIDSLLEEQPIPPKKARGNSSSSSVRSLSAHQNSVMDRIQQTLDHAARIIRESLELVVGGVVFLDPTIDYSGGTFDQYGSARQTAHRSSSKVGDLGPIKEESIAADVPRSARRKSNELAKTARVQATSTSLLTTWDHQIKSLDGKTLQLLISTYPKGNIWYKDEDGYFSSFEQTKEQKRQVSFPRSRRLPYSPDYRIRQKTEAALLSSTFQNARQIIFIPLWDAGTDRWFSGCFVWSEFSTPVWTVNSEIAYLSSFTNSLMVEINRLDAIVASKMKSDFISSISHEFRSPLHGILASAEFLHESKLDTSQIELVSTIQNCSETLLDTINHVLDYSKINSFEKTGSQQNTITNELYQVTNVALLCEDIINGMIAAKQFRGTGHGDFSSAGLSASREIPQISSSMNESVKVIIDIDKLNWEHKVQAGALRRVIMNVFGNAQKYTASGFIIVHLGLSKEVSIDSSSDPIPPMLSLLIKDTGRGMSKEYMERKLYQPFAQEDSFATGVGLGLSIVRSIVHQLKGKINVRSKVGKGTEVVVTLPLEPVDEPDGSHAEPKLKSSNNSAEKVIQNTRRRVNGKSVRIAPSTWNQSWDCIERYLKDWYGYRVVIEGDADLIITDEILALGSEVLSHRERSRILLIYDNHASKENYNLNQYGQPIVEISSPVGPFKLARTILALLDEAIILPLSSTRVDVSTQTPSATPNESDRTDYDFETPRESQSLRSLPLGQTSMPNDSSHMNAGLEEALAKLQPLTLQQPPSRRLPLETSRGSKPVSDPLPAKQPPKQVSRDLRILIVDDNALNLQLLYRYLLKRKGDTIVKAVNGLEAVKTFQQAMEADQCFDIIFMDLSMPVMDGFEATRQIRDLESFQTASDSYRLVSDESSVRQSQKHAFVIALTGLASQRDRNEARKSGFDDFLTKPFAFAKIGELLEKLSTSQSNSILEP